MCQKVNNCYVYSDILCNKQSVEWFNLPLSKALHSKANQRHCDFTKAEIKICIYVDVKI